MIFWSSVILGQNIFNTSANILELLRAHTLQGKKSYVGHSSVPHLGLILDTTGGRSDPSRVQVLAQWPTYSNSHDLKIFFERLGTTSLSFRSHYALHGFSIFQIGIIPLRLRRMHFSSLLGRYLNREVIR
jgi:hypothetical protein